MRIFLIGFMGSGKSTLGRRLAARLNCPFVDLDHAIEAQEGQSISEIFAERGETAFRALEHQRLLEAIERHADGVFSTGGGAPCYHNHMELMNRVGLTIYLRMEPAMLFSRLEKGRAHRPLIAGKSDEQLRAYIADTLSAREPCYRQARVTVDHQAAYPERILQVIGPYLENPSLLESPPL